MNAALRLMMATGLVLVVSCSNSFDRQAADEAFLRTYPDASTVEAGCVVDGLVSEFGIDGLELELSASGPSPAFQIAQFRAMFDCGLTGEVEREIVRQLRDSGLNPEAAACAGKELTSSLDSDGLDVLLSGEITETFYEQYFVARDLCDALP